MSSRRGKVSDRSGQETMEVLVIVAMPPVETNVSEKAWEQDILKAGSIGRRGSA